MSPQDRAALFSAAGAAHAAGNLLESERLFRQLTASGPDLDAQLFLGIVTAKMGRHAEAGQLLETVLRERPNSLEALFWLSIFHRKEGRYGQAIALARQATDLQPQTPATWNNLGVCLIEAHEPEGAVEAFGRSCQLSPNDPTALYNLASCLGLIGRDEAALELLRQAASLAPKSAEIRLLTAKTLLNLNDVPGAISEGEAALSLGPNSAAVHRLLALAQMHSGNVASARQHIDRALKFNPTDGVAYATLGSVLQSSGCIDQAAKAFRRSIELEPIQAQAHFSLVHNQRLQEADRELLVRMQALVSNAKLPPRDLSSLHYGLGKGYEDLGDYEKAMDHYDAANRIARGLKFADAPYDTAQSAASTDLKTNRYDAAFFRGAAGQGLESAKPIFIVGMMRSGTTLVEHILSSHPEVTAGGELEFWLKRGLECIDAGGRPDMTRLRVIAREYLKLLSEIASETPHVTDKMPANYLHLGLIHAAFPNARIVHTRRNPADTAVSIYATPNRARIDYAHDKAAIVFAYRQYERLMDHWRRHIPPERLIEVRYEELVADRDRITRSLAEFCGLDWSDAMLTPEANNRSVVTPSAWQVRQPVYTTSLARWKRFEPWLGPFRDLVDQ